MQEKTLEEGALLLLKQLKLEDKIEKGHAIYCLHILKTAIQKAREEGRRDSWDILKARHEIDKRDAITQYKKELLGKLPKELVNTKEESNSDWFYGKGWNNALSEVKKLIKDNG